LQGVDGIGQAIVSSAIAGSQNRVSAKQRRSQTMGRVNPNPKKFIISCRVNAREMRTLQERADAAGLSITMLLRESLELHGQEMMKQRQTA
jgi:hypothetical protein